jgi:hypothetical protein
MRIRFFFAALSLSVISCTDVFLGDAPPNTPVAVFDEFWKGVNSTWPEFQSRGLDWDSVYTVYRPLVGDGTNEIELRAIMTNMSFTLKDTHTTIYPSTGGSIYYWPPYPRNFYGIEWVKSRYSTTFKDDGNITYGLIHPDIGYIHIRSFGGSIDRFKVIDAIMQQFGNKRGIIIDVRDNGGGGDDRGRVISNWFVDARRVYGYYRWRTGPGREQMSKLVAAETEPVRDPYAGRVAVLINRNSYSATENFVMVMASLPNVVLVGDNTGGGSGTKPVLKELPNGWTYRVSSMLFCDANTKPITGGIPPDIVSHTKKSDSVVRKDSIIEAAVTELLR